MPEKQKEPELSDCMRNPNTCNNQFCTFPTCTVESAATAQPVPPRNKRIQELCAKLQRESNDDYQCPHKPSCKELEDAAPSPVLTQPSAEQPDMCGTCCRPTKHTVMSQGTYIGSCPDCKQPFVHYPEAERPVLPVPPLTRFSVYPWLNETIKVSGWNVGRFIQFCEEHEHMDDLADTIIAWQARASSPAPTERCPSCGSREKAYRLCMIENCGEPHFEETIFSSTHMKAVCSDSWHTAAPAATKEK